MSKDITWKESNIHSTKNEQSRDEKGNLKRRDDDSDNDDEEEIMNDFAFNLFSSPKEEIYETFEYDYSFPPKEEHDHDHEHEHEHDIRVPKQTIKIRGQSEINNSTGLSMWLGSEVISQYLLQNSNLIRNKTVLELGAGLGLVGITCHFIGASKVILTDGDTTVLNNLRFNVGQNIDGYSDENDNGGSGDSSSYPAVSVSCPQHIWGNDIDNFIESYGKANVIIATDCVYIPQSLEPLWQSIDQLLLTNVDNHGEESEHDDKDNKNERINNNNNDGIFIYTNRCASAAPIEMVLEMATRFGFTWTTSSSTLKEDEGDELSDKVFIFTKERKQGVK